MVLRIFSKSEWKALVMEFTMDFFILFYMDFTITSGFLYSTCMVYIFCRFFQTNLYVVRYLLSSFTALSRRMGVFGREK